MLPIPDYEKRRTDIGEQIHAIEGELFLLSEGAEGLDFSDGNRFLCLCEERTQLAGELLLYPHR